MTLASASLHGRIVTFYSYKGGTGRSMALANVAWILAESGKKVLIMDWDLEAPGIHRYFHPFLIDKSLTATPGVIDFLSGYMIEAMTPNSRETNDIDAWLRSVADVSRHVLSIDYAFRDGGLIDFMPAGRQGPTYATRVTSFGWQEFYDRFGGGRFLNAVRDRLRKQYDWILIDSRTGVSDSAGICTVQMPDCLVVCFTMNTQSIEGGAGVCAAVREQRPDLPVFPVPTRVEVTSEKERLELARREAHQRFGSFLPTIDTFDRRKYWDDVEFIYVPFYAYEEILATFGDPSGQTPSVLASAEHLTARITEGTVKTMPEQQDTKRLVVLEQFKRKPAVATVDELTKRSPELGTVLEEFQGRLKKWLASGLDKDLLSASALSRIDDLPELRIALLDNATFRSFFEKSVRLRDRRKQVESRLHWLMFSSVFATASVMSLTLASQRFPSSRDGIIAWSLSIACLGLCGGTLSETLDAYVASQPQRVIEGWFRIAKGVGLSAILVLFSLGTEPTLQEFIKASIIMPIASFALTRVSDNLGALFDRSPRAKGSVT